MREGLKLTTPLQTVLQMYYQHYKSPALAHAHALLRRARRLDEVLGAVADIVASSRTTPASNYAPMSYLGTGVN